MTHVTFFFTNSQGEGFLARSVKEFFASSGSEAHRVCVRHAKYEMQPAFDKHGDGSFACVFCHGGILEGKFHKASSRAKFHALMGALAPAGLVWVPPAEGAMEDEANEVARRLYLNGYDRPDLAQRVREGLAERGLSQEAVAMGIVARLSVEPDERVDATAVVELALRGLRAEA